MGVGGGQVDGCEQCGLQLENWPGHVCLCRGGLDSMKHCGNIGEGQSILEPLHPKYWGTMPPPVPMLMVQVVDNSM